MKTRIGLFSAVANLDELAKAIQNNFQLKFVNHGGCGVLAVNIAKHLESILDPSVWEIGVGVLDYSRSSYLKRNGIDLKERFSTALSHVNGNSKLNRVSTWNTFEIQFDHMVATVKSRRTGIVKLFDSRFGLVSLGKFKKSSYQDIRLIGIMPVEVAHGVAYDRSSGNWNTAFDNRLIPTVEQVVAEKIGQAVLDKTGSRV